MAVSRGKARYGNTLSQGKVMWPMPRVHAPHLERDAKREKREKREEDRRKEYDKNKKEQKEAKKTAKDNPNNTESVDGSTPAPVPGTLQMTPYWEHGFWSIPHPGSKTGKISMGHVANLRQNRTGDRSDFDVYDINTRAVVGNAMDKPAGSPPYPISDKFPTGYPPGKGPVVNPTPPVPAPPPDTGNQIKTPSGGGTGSVNAHFASAIMNTFKR